MPLITDFPELPLEGLEIDSIERKFPLIEVSFGSGYRAGAYVGASGGLHEWTLSSGVWPDHEAYGSLIDGLPRMEFYSNFFEDRMIEGNSPFLIEYRGQRYLVCFSDPMLAVEMATIDLFSQGGVRIRQCRVVGLGFNTDGSVFDPEIDGGFAGTSFSSETDGRIASTIFSDEINGGLA